MMSDNFPLKFGFPLIQANSIGKSCREEEKR